MLAVRFFMSISKAQNNEGIELYFKFLKREKMKQKQIEENIHTYGLYCSYHLKCRIKLIYHSKNWGII